MMDAEAIGNIERWTSFRGGNKLKDFEFGFLVGYQGRDI